MESDVAAPGVHRKIEADTTQSAYPWRATARTVFAVLVGVAGSWGLIVQTLGLDTTWQWVSVATAIAAGITRLLALPQVEVALQTYFPWLAAAPGR